MKWGLKIISYANALLVLFSFFAYLSPIVNPSITWFFSFFGLGYPILLILNLVFIVFWLFVKPKYILLSLITLAIGYKPLLRTVGFNTSSSIESGLKLMTYNIGHSKYYFTGSNLDQKINDFKSFISTENPDIVCLQERSKAHLDIYDQIFSDYHLYPSEYIGTCIYTKQKPLNNGNLYFDTNAHNASWVDIEYKGGGLRIYCIHLSSNKVKNLTDNYKEIWDESLFILDKYNLHAVKRTKQLIEILEHAKSSPYPILITGDFNDIPQSYLYNLVSKEYRDAFLDHGRGMAKTHNSAIPGLRIDYAFHSENLNILGQEIIKAKFSDHYPLITVIDL